MMEQLMMVKLVVVLSLLLMVTEQATVQNYQQTLKARLQARNFLSKYGYLKLRAYQGIAEIPDTDFSRALINMQRYAGIPETGELDNTTLTQMRAARCSHPDPVVAVGGEVESKDRQKRYVYSGLRWRNRDILTVRFLNYSARFEATAQDDVMASVAAEWSAICDNIELKLLRQGSTAYADIFISFDDYTTHGRRHRLGGRYAYGYYPTNGDIKIDNTEPWDARTLRVLLLHEIGHSLGLDHSRSRDAIMYGYLKFDQLRLNQDDINGLKSVYCPE